MAKLLICSLVFLLATLSGARVCIAQDCPCPPRPCWDCDTRICIPPGCPTCWRLPLPVCTHANQQPPAPVDTYDGYSLFSFGDSFADNGNLPNASANDLQRPLIRPWYNPYGASYGNDDGSFSSQPVTTGRFSNYMVQSDFVAKMLGLDMAPPPNMEQRNSSSYDDTGVTFATGGSGVFTVPMNVWTLSNQVDAFADLISSNKISPARLAKSVALVAVSGNDYDRVGVAVPSDLAEVSAFARNVTSAIASSVDRLRALGVPKVLVNNLHPIGCSPAQTRASDHSGCDGAGNTGADTHNKNLASLLNGKDGVLVVDLHTAFTEQSAHFKNRLTPCCRIEDGGSFCGDTGDDGTGPRDLYSLCPNPKVHFYWDDMHPTQTAWAAVMAQVEDSIKQFVGIAQG